MKTKIRRRFIFCSTLLIVLLLGVDADLYAQSTDQYKVVGTVVDANGQPYLDASVFLEPIEYLSTSFERFITGDGPDQSGRFEIVRNKTKVQPGQSALLFVVADESTDALSTIRPPFDAVRRFDKSFDGIKITYGSSNLIDVGRVNVRFWFGQAKIKTYTRVPWSETYLRIRDPKGNTVYFQSLSAANIARYVRRDKSELSISLPEGRWRVELLSWNGKLIFGRSNLFRIVRKEWAAVEMLP
jgi:hypothetical protein